MSLRSRENSTGRSARRNTSWAFFAALFACVMACVLIPQALSATAFGDAVTASDTEIPTVSTTWPDFRGDSTNNAITAASTPRTKNDAGLIWAVKFEDGYVSPEIIVNDEVIVTSGRGKAGKITKLNKKTGKVIAEASMQNSSTYSLMPPTYADGKIFVTLSGGSMEAFDAKTLKSLWYYQDKAGGQGNCPILYSDGLVYTGYWSGETAERAFVCVNAETGKLVWEKTCAGGYYWAGAIALGDYLLFGCDDGKSAEEVGTSYVRCVDKKTGKDVSSVKVRGDQRSSIVYDSEQGRIYFTSKPGWLYSAKFDQESGQLSGLKSVKIDEETTATPLVYEGRVYVGASSGSFSAGTLSVADAETLKLLYQLNGQSGISGTVKSAPLLSTAYADKNVATSDGKLYLYLTVNNPPGGITLVTVEPGSTLASQAKAIALFTPPTALQQYCIASVICDQDGNLYYRNDSNYLMCIGPSGVDPANYKVPENDSGSNSGSGPGSGSNSKGSSKSGSKSKGSSKSANSSSKSSDSSEKSSASRRTGPIQNGSAPSTANGGSGRTTATGSARTSSNSASSASASAKSASSASSKASAAKTKEAGAKSTAQDDKRHTDAVAATGHLDDALDEGSPAWRTPAIIGISAIAALAALALARIIMARRRSEGEEEATDHNESSASGESERSD